MTRKHFYIIVIFLFTLNTVLKSQVNCTVPLPPVFTSVSVRPETGNIEFTWLPSSSSNVAAYLIYEYFNENGVPRGNIIDTVWNPAGTSYSYASPSYKYHSSSYVVAAYSLPGIPGMDGCPSRFSNVLNTIFTTAAIDTCIKKITVNWNSYNSSPRKVTGYSLLVSVNGGALREEETVDSSTGSFTFNDFEINADYCYVVRADLEGGTYSTSNESCISTKMFRPPQWINADYASVNAENEISLSFSIAPGSEISKYILEKQTGESFSGISTIEKDNDRVQYIDKQADLESINTYRLSAINSCNVPVTISNTCSNIVVSLERNGDNIDLSWNAYRGWLGEVALYRLFIKTGTGFEEKAELLPSDTSHRILYTEIMYDISGNELCFYVSAEERSNPYGINGLSNSSVVCSALTEIITVPNVFTPNNDMINDYFKPVLSFTPVDYHLVISDRNGRILFETRDFHEEWDGSQRGNSKSGGVCLWFLEVTTPSGKSISKTGTITIVKI